MNWEMVKDIAMLIHLVEDGVHPYVWNILEVLLQYLLPNGLRVILDDGRTLIIRIDPSTVKHYAMLQWIGQKIAISYKKGVKLTC